MIEFGTGPTLSEACRWLRDDKERHSRILDVAERNSVIEGLPTFDEVTRRLILQTLKEVSPAEPFEAHLR